MARSADDPFETFGSSGNSHSPVTGDANRFAPGFALAAVLVDRTSSLAYRQRLVDAARGFAGASPTTVGLSRSADGSDD